MSTGIVCLGLVLALMSFCLAGAALGHAICDLLKRWRKARAERRTLDRMLRHVRTQRQEWARRLLK